MSKAVLILTFSGHSPCDGKPTFHATGFSYFSYLGGYFVPVCLLVTELFIFNPLPTHLQVVLIYTLFRHEDTLFRNFTWQFTLYD